MDKCRRGNVKRKKRRGGGGKGGRLGCKVRNKECREKHAGSKFIVEEDKSTGTHWW